MTKKMVQETVYNGGPYDSNGWPPEDPAGFMAWFQDRINQIPEEHRAKATIEFSSEGGYYGEHSAHIEITYMRPETDEQYQSRLRREADEARQKARLRESQERVALAQLLAKYGPPAA
jgi:GGDEF domain-containing protein